MVVDSIFKIWGETFSEASTAFQKKTKKFLWSFTSLLCGNKLKQHCRCAKKHTWCGQNESLPSWFIINFSRLIIKHCVPLALALRTRRHRGTLTRCSCCPLGVNSVNYRQSCGFHRPAAPLAFRTVIGIFVGLLNCWHNMMYEVNSSEGASPVEEGVRAFRKRAAASVLSDEERKTCWKTLNHTHTHTHTGRLTQRLEPLAVVVNIDVESTLFFYPL